MILTCLSVDTDQEVIETIEVIELQDHIHTVPDRTIIFEAIHHTQKF